MIVLRNAHNLVDQLKRKVGKCQEKKLATWILTLTSHLDDLASSTPDGSLSDEPETQYFPPEILNLILSFASDTSSLVKIARTSRLFYITVCHVLLARLRRGMSILRSALPQKGGDVTLEDEMEVVSIELDRWVEHEDGVGYRELERRVQTLKDLVADINKWTRQWTPRKMTRRPAKAMVDLRQCPPLY